VAPVIAGTAQDGNTLSVTNDGTWTNSPTSFSVQWRRNGVDIAGANGSTYLLTIDDVGATITALITASNAGGIGTALSNALGPVAAAGGLPTPTVTNVSAAGAVPLVLQMSATGNPSGLYLHWQFTNTLTPTYNADGSYSSTVTQWGITQVDADAWSRLDIALGYNDPSGPFAFHVRLLQDDPTGTPITDQFGQTATYKVGSFSTDYTDTISGSVTKLNSATGVNKSRYLTIDGTLLHATFNANVNALRLVRSDHSFTGKKHFEVSIDAGSTSTNGWALIGFDDGSQNLDATSSYPSPGTTSPGAGFFVKAGTTSTFVRRNGAQVGGTALPAVPAIGDKLIAEADTTANTVTFKWFRAADSSVTTIATVTLTSQIPATWYGNVGAGQVNDQITANFGASAFSVAPSTGYTGW
jgi:hypothetical protein